MKPLIRVYESVGLGLIVEAPTGVVYSNQTGGHCCLQPELEGAFVPFRNDESFGGVVRPEAQLLAYFEGPKHGGTGATSGLDEQDADFIDEVLAKAKLADIVRVDRTRLADSHEAWVCVLLLRDDDEPVPLFQGFAPFPRRAVLTWGNSD